MVDQITAKIMNPHTREVLGRVSLVGAPIPGNGLVSSSGRLQGFLIQVDKGHIWQSWLDQQNVLLQTEFNQYLVRVVTYPTDRENLGYLDFIQKVDKAKESHHQSEPRQRPRKKRTLLKSLLRF